jgi:hypothetical protein
MKEGYIYVFFSALHIMAQQPGKRPKEIGEIRVLGGKGDDRGGSQFKTNKQTNKIVSTTYLLQSTYSRVLNFIITLLQTPKFLLTYTFFAFSLVLYITFLKHFFY